MEKTNLIVKESIGQENNNYYELQI